MKILNEIAFNKGGIFVISKERKFNSPNIAAVQFNRELLQLGYTLPEEALYIIDENYVKTYGETILTYIYNFLGWEGHWRPLFNEFPKRIWSSIESDLELIQMRHYINNWIPEEGEEYFIQDNDISIDDEIYKNATTLNLLDKDDLVNIYKRVLGMNQSIPSIEKEYLNFLLSKKGWIIEPDSIPFKENLSFYIKSRGQEAIKYCSSITDILRGIFYYLNLSPVLELPKKWIKNGWGKRIENEERRKYKIPNIKRRERKFILSLIESYCLEKNVNKDDLKKFRKFWIKLGEKLHPGEFSKKYPFSNEIFRICRDEKIESFGTRLMDAYKIDQDHVLKVLSERPGEFFRRFDSLYRNENFNKTKTLNALVELKNPPSTKVILELLEHLKRRTDSGFVRKIKLVNSRESFILPTLEKLDESDVLMVRDYFLMLLMENYSKQESLLGKTVVIEDNVDDVRLPKDMRNSSEALRIVSKGTSIDLPEDTKYLRAYSYWNDPIGKEDLDLYCTFIKENLEESYNIGWDSSFKCEFAVHSGDVRNVVGGCAEYVDIKINEAIENGYRYVCIDVYDYEGNGFNKIDNMSGICTIDKIDSPVLNWKPSKNIIQAFKLNTPGNSVLAMIIDLVDRKAYMIDEDLGNIPVGSYHVSSKKQLIKEYLTEPMLGVKKLLEINSIARGAVVINSEEFSKIENPELDNYIFYKKEDLLSDYSIMSNILN